MPKLVWEVTEVDPGVSWTWRQRSPGGTTFAHHEVVPQDDGRTLVRQRIDQRGPIGVAVGVLMRRLTKRYLALEAQGLKACGEQVRHGDAPCRLTTADARSCSTPSSTRSPAVASADDRCARSPRRSARATACSCTTSGRGTSCCSPIVEEVERRQMATLADLPDDPADAVAAMWADLRRPELRPFERLFFECYARAAQGEAPFARLLPAAVDGWLAEVDERSGGRRRSRRWCASASPSPAACSSTSWRPATRRASTPPPPASSPSCEGAREPEGRAGHCHIAG